MTKKDTAKKPLPMTDNEIYLSFKNAKGKKEQIIILSELNACDVQQIREALMRQGISPQQLPRKRRKQPTGEGGKPKFMLNATSSSKLDGFKVLDPTTSTVPAAPTYKVPTSVRDAVKCRLHELDSFKGTVAAKVEEAEKKAKEEKENLREIYEEIAELEEFLAKTEQK